MAKPGEFRVVRWVRTPREWRSGAKGGEWKRRGMEEAGEWKGRGKDEGGNWRGRTEEGSRLWTERGSWGHLMNFVFYLLLHMYGNNFIKLRTPFFFQCVLTNFCRL